MDRYAVVDPHSVPATASFDWHHPREEECFASTQFGTDDNLEVREGAVLKIEPLVVVVQVSHSRYSPSRDDCAASAEYRVSAAST